MYFDNFPHGHYGTIRQQIWSLLHFPFQLAIVGVVEGSQQLAIARYTMKTISKIGKELTQLCDVERLDGTELRDGLLSILHYFELDGKLETMKFFHDAQSAIFKMGNSTGICATVTDDWPQELWNVSSSISNGLYVGLGIKIPVKKLEHGFQPLDIALESWELVYMYYWACFCVLILCLTIFLFLIRRHKVDLFDYTSIISRVIVLGVGSALLGLYANKAALYAALQTALLLPICVILLFLVLVSDKLSSMWCNSRLKKSGEPYVLEVEEHHHKDSQVYAHLGHGQHSSVHLENGGKSAHYSMHSYSDSTPLATSTEYHGHHGFAMESLSTPPLLSPEHTTTPGAKPVGPGEYMPAGTGREHSV